MKKQEYILATQVNGTWYYIKRIQSYDWDDIFCPTDSMWKATLFDTKEKAKRTLNKIKNQINGIYDSYDVFQILPEIPQTAWKAYKANFIPAFEEI